MSRSPDSLEFVNKMVIDLQCIILYHVKNKCTDL